MKTKLITLSIIVTSTICLFSFKSAADKESNIALVSSVFGKGETEGFFISYGDGTTELKPYVFNARPEKITLSISAIAVIMNEMRAKGYHYVGLGAHAVYFAPVANADYMVFEKK